MINRISSAYQTRFKVTDSVVLESGVTIPCISGQVGQVDVVSQNGYRYKSDFWDIVLSNSVVQDQIARRKMLGMIEHPEDDEKFLSTPYDEASHVVMKAWVQDHNPFATFGLLNNPQGNALKALVDVGCWPGVSTRGLGHYDRDQVSQFVSPDDYVLITWDCVRRPNFSELSMAPVTDSMMASPVFKQLCEMHQLKDSSSTDFNRQKLINEISAAVADILSKYNLK